MKTPVFLSFALSLAIHTTGFSANELTPDQISSLKARLKAIKENLESVVTSRNTSAAQTFASAAVDPKAAVELYLKCVKVVDYDREGRPESDFKGWKDAQSDRITQPEFVASLQLQLSYLALSCKAAESEDKTAVFNALLAHVDGLSRLTEMPSGGITQSVANSVFAKTYYLENLLGKNDEWESVPINIAGIYSRTILPYLRKENPAALMNAWDKRIDQQTRFVMMLEEQKEKELRGMNRDEERRTRNAQSNQGGAMKDHSKEEFTNHTLPRLQWGKLKDMFLFVDQVSGAKAMLDFVEANLNHEYGEEFYSEFEQLIESAEPVGSARLTPEPQAEPGANQ
jgi:hypothetical protein